MRKNYRDYDDDEQRRLSREFNGSDDRPSYPNRRDKNRRQAATPRTPWDPNKVPDGYDETLWRLALGFQAGAEFYGCGLTQGVPIIYGQIKRRLELDTELRDLDNRGKIVAAMIKVFWNDVIRNDNYHQALSYFTNREVWDDCKGIVRNMWEKKKIADAIANGTAVRRQPAAPPPDRWGRRSSESDADELEDSGVPGTTREPRTGGIEQLRALLGAKNKTEGK